MRKPVLLSVLASLLLFVGACEDESGNLTRPADFSSATTPDLNVAGDCEWAPTSPATLASLEWEEFEGTLQPGTGGFIYAPSASWGAGASFSIQVPPGALPAGAGATDFSLRFPDKASYLNNEGENCENGLPVILEMEPSGMVFLEPVTVYATYMPWTDVTAQDVRDAWWSSTPDGPYELLWVREKKGVVTFAYKAWHFSRWETGGPDPPQPPE